jgi:hypothetical protein
MKGSREEHYISRDKMAKKQKKNVYDDYVWDTENETLAFYRKGKEIEVFDLCDLIRLAADEANLEEYED